MRALLDVIMYILEFYVYVLIGSAILSWLIAFNVVNTRNQFVSTISDILYRLTEPVLAPIRRFIPPFGGLDLSFLVLWFAIIFIQRVIIRNLYPLAPF
jgi:YggT family protein